MLAEWEIKHPGRIETIFRSIANVMPSQLADASLFDFAGIDTPGDRPRVDAQAWPADAAVGLADGTLDSG